MHTQKQHDRAATTALPPEHPIDFWPCDLCTVAEMNLVSDWLKATLRCRSQEEFERAAKGWTLEARAEIAGTLARMREIGFYPDRVDENGRTVWGIMLKSAIRIKMERHAGHYERIGRDIREQTRTGWPAECVVKDTTSGFGTFNGLAHEY